jgi:hypothetical protein
MVRRCNMDEGMFDTLKEGLDEIEKQYEDTEFDDSTDVDYDLDYTVQY